MKMAREKRFVTPIGMWLLCLCLVFSVSCESKEKYAGKYVATQKDASTKEKIYLELKPSGDGSWIVGDREVSFSWYIKGGDLRVNTKEGGVLVGKIEGNTIKITLPMRGEIVFTKTQ
jgi:hypothetical protein